MARAVASPEGYLELFIPVTAHAAISASIFGFDENGNELVIVENGGELVGCNHFAVGAGYFTKRSACVGVVTFDFYADD